MGSRRTARICALQMLYETEYSGVSGEEAIRLYWASFEPKFIHGPRSEEAEQFANMLVRGVLENQEEIDNKIQASSTNWRLNRMAAVDRNILRLAVSELLYLTEIPKRVSINEAIELGKQFGSEDSRAFINGVLDNISKKIDKE